MTNTIKLGIHTKDPEAVFQTKGHALKGVYSNMLRIQQTSIMDLIGMTDTSDSESNVLKLVSLLQDDYSQMVYYNMSVYHGLFIPNAFKYVSVAECRT